MKLTLVMASTLATALGLAGAFAQSDPINERSKLMSALWREAFGPLTKMAQGQVPFEKETVEKSFSRMSEIAAQLPPLWPPGSQATNPTTRYYSSPKVWENKADFDARLIRFAKTIEDNRHRAISDVNGFKAAHEAVKNACDSCHEVYQLRSNR